MAVFVDAGYLFAAGSAALSGANRPRVDTTLNVPAFVEAICDLVDREFPGESLLRIYWYDGINARKETEQQREVAEFPNVKARFGIINSSGQQKGVDSLIVTDLVDLARERSISTALLLAGDEDLRIGVEIAQRYGVRVHLLGILPSRGNQSPLLRREADTTSEWTGEFVENFLKVRQISSASANVAPRIAGQADSADSSSPGDASDRWTRFVRAFVDRLDEADRRAIIRSWDAKDGVPSLFDRRLLHEAGRLVAPNELDLETKRYLRVMFVVGVRTSLEE